jgi:tRNA (cmo5U34)-methyltransferase
MGIVGRVSPGCRVICGKICLANCRTRRPAECSLNATGLGKLGWTAECILAAFPKCCARLIGIDESAGTLAAGSAEVAADLRAGRLEDPLPGGNFDLVVSALAVHHLDGAGKADLFAPSRPVTGGADGTCSAMPWYPTIRPPSLHLSTACTTQVRWLAAVGLDADVVWARQDLAVIVADSPS